MLLLTFSNDTKNWVELWLFGNIGLNEKLKSLTSCLKHRVVGSSRKSKKRLRLENYWLEELGASKIRGNLKHKDRSQSQIWKFFRNFCIGRSLLLLSKKVESLRTKLEQCKDLTKVDRSPLTQRYGTRTSQNFLESKWNHSIFHIVFEIVPWRT